jgi:hypothetical protein
MNTYVDLRITVTGLQTETVFSKRYDLKTEETAKDRKVIFQHFDRKYPSLRSLGVNDVSINPLETKRICFI